MLCASNLLCVSHTPMFLFLRLVNSTLYYILSSMDSKLHDKGIKLAERLDLTKRLQVSICIE